MYGVMTEAPFVERATAVQWNYTGDALGILHYVVGDPDAFERAIQDIPEVVGYDMERIDERSCYVYVRDATTESLQEMFGPISSGGLVVVPPIEYDPDGTVAFSMFGPDDELQDAIERISVPVDVPIEAVGGLVGTTAAVEAALTATSGKSSRPQWNWATTTFPGPSVKTRWPPSWAVHRAPSLNTCGKPRRGYSGRCSPEDGLRKRTH